MGMMDYFRSSYELGEHFTNTRCQTKDIEEGYGGTMSDYWLSPSGQLYLIDYSHTADFVELKEGDDGYNAEVALFNFTWIPNGTHGKVRPWYITKYISIYPEQWEGEWKEWPTLKLHFRYGKLIDYEDITGQR
jgi:hypothetical protein